MPRPPLSAEAKTGNAVTMKPNAVGMNTEALGDAENELVICADKT